MSEPKIYKRKSDSLDIKENKKPKYDVRNDSSTSANSDGKRYPRKDSKIPPHCSSSDEEKEAERKPRERKLIISRLDLNNEPKNDRARVEAVFKEIGEDVNKIKKVERIFITTSPLVIVELHHKDDKISMYESVKNLKKSDSYKYVFIQLD